MRKWRLILPAFFIIGLVVYNYFYKPHRDIESESPAFTINSTVLLEEFLLNETSATKKYLNQTIMIKGITSDVDGKVLQIDNKIVCYMMDNRDLSIAKQTEVTIKGRFLGYDELLDELKLDQCSIVKH